MKTLVVTDIWLNINFRSFRNLGKKDLILDSLIRADNFDKFKLQTVCLRFSFKDTFIITYLGVDITSLHIFSSTSTSSLEWFLASFVLFLVWCLVFSFLQDYKRVCCQDRSRKGIQVRLIWSKCVIFKWWNLYFISQILTKIDILEFSLSYHLSLSVSPIPSYP